MVKKKTYVCLGTCQAVIDEDRYNAGLTQCGADNCTNYKVPFVEGNKSEITGKNEAAVKDDKAPDA